MKQLVLFLTTLLCAAAFLNAANLEKTSQIDLRKLIHRDEQSLRAHEHPVGAVSFSPSGERIAILVGVHPKEDPKEKGYRSDLVVVDANHLDQIVRKFEISDPPFGGLDEPQIQWSLDGKRMALGGKVFPIEGPSYCGRGEVRGFLGADRFLAFIPSEMVRLFGVGREQPARRLYLAGPGCDDEVRVPTHELNWFLEDFSAQRNIALFDRLHGPLNQRVHEFIVVQFPEGSILHSWEVGINGRFVNGGSDVCLGSGIDETGPVTSSCWDVDSGGKIADIPANGGFPIMPAANAPRLIVSDLRWQRHIIFDGGREVVRRRILWDYSTGKELASWSPPIQTYHDAWVHKLREEPFACALSPDGKIIAEAGNGVLRLYGVRP